MRVKKLRGEPGEFKVLKYTIPRDKWVFSVDMPVTAKVLCVQVQKEVPCIWALVNINMPPAPRTFRLITTGEQLGDEFSLRYVGTVQLNGGILVLHLFEEI
jgi:hypothetical protein